MLHGPADRDRVRGREARGSRPDTRAGCEREPRRARVRATLALALAEGHQTKEAQSILDQAAASNFAELPWDVTWLAVVCIYSHVSARLRQLPASKTLYALLEPWAAQIAFPAFGVWGPVSLYLGSLALVLGDHDNADRHLSAALSAATKAEAPLWKVRASHH